MRIAAVIVTYNRLDKLRKVLKAFDSQKTLPDQIIVVDNNSSDGTLSFLKQWSLDESLFKKQLISLCKNIGGSGGFYEGMKSASEQGFDWIWLSDDDAYPYSDALYYAKNYIDSHDSEKISAICGEVVGYDGIDYYHRRSIITNKLKVIDIPSNSNDYNKEEFKINLFSYVGVMINNNAMKKAGYTKKDYFIWCDDSEHSLRLSKEGDILCIPAIKVYHDCDISPHNMITWKYYYGQRNRLDMIKCNMPKAVYLYELAHLRLRIVSLFIRGKKEMAKMLLCSVNDSVKGKFGIHPVYRPGWKLGGR